MGDLITSLSGEQLFIIGVLLGMCALLAAGHRIHLRNLRLQAREQYGDSTGTVRMHSRDRGDL